MKKSPDAEALAVTISAFADHIAKAAMVKDVALEAKVKAFKELREYYFALIGKKTKKDDDEDANGFSFDTMRRKMAEAEEAE